MKIWNRSTRGVLGAWTVATVFAFAAPAEVQAQAGTEAVNGSESVVKRIDPTDFSTRLEVRNEYQDVQGGGSM